MRMTKKIVIASVSFNISSKKIIISCFQIWFGSSWASSSLSFNSFSSAFCRILFRVHALRKWNNYNKKIKLFFSLRSLCGSQHEQGNKMLTFQTSVTISIQSCSIKICTRFQIYVYNVVVFSKKSVTISIQY